MPKPVHEKNTNVISLYTIATRIERTPVISVKRRGALGVYGELVTINGVICASVDELRRRGFRTTEGV